MQWGRITHEVSSAELVIGIPLGAETATSRPMALSSCLRLGILGRPDARVEKRATALIIEVKWTILTKGTEKGQNNTEICEVVKRCVH